MLFFLLCPLAILWKYSVLFSPFSSHMSLDLWCQYSSSFSYKCRRSFWTLIFLNNTGLGRDWKFPLIFLDQATLGKDLSFSSYHVPSGWHPPFQILFNSFNLICITSKLCSTITGRDEILETLTKIFRLQPSLIKSELFGARNRLLHSIKDDGIMMRYLSS
jgi:hypothetical protein